MAPTPPAFHGIHPILYAFFGPDGALDRDAMRRQVEACVAGGAHGLAVLGLATEVGKLTPGERRDVIEWAKADLAAAAARTGAPPLPLAVTVFGHTPAEQIEAVRHAEAAGASWLILQPPPRPGLPEEELMRFFAPVLEAAGLPVGLQNAPELMGLGLSPASLGEMARRHPNLAVLKAEGPAVLVREIVERVPDLAVLNGRGGLELPDTLRAGCAGLIPAPDCFEAQVKIYEAMARGEEAEAERLYRSILPAIAFAMQGVAHLVCYGKRLVGARLGIPVHDRAPGVLPTPFGEAIVRRLAAELGPYPSLP